MEEQFINERIATDNLPKFEDVALTALHPSYQKVIGLNLALVFGSIAIAAGAGFYFIEELGEFWLPITVGYAVIVIVAISISFIRLRNSGFAFRTHDAIYRSGAVATTTTIIPYNRVQHVAVYEGVISRAFGLAEIEIFTAGGHKSDIQIPGIEKEQAEKIKQLLMGKIINQDNDAE